MQQGKIQNRGRVIITAAVMVVLFIAVLMSGEKTVEARVAQGPIFVHDYQGPKDGDKTPKGQDNKGDSKGSADNKLIAYQSNLHGAGDIYVYEISTKMTRQLTDSTTW